MAEVGKTMNPSTGGGEWGRDRSGHRRANHRPCLGRHPRAEPSTAALVAVDLLRDDRLLARLRRALPRNPAPQRRLRRGLRLLDPRQPSRTKSLSPGRPRPDASTKSPTCRSRRSRRMPTSTASPSPVAARPSWSTASSAMVPARRARPATPTSTTTTGCGAGRSTTSTRPSPTASGRITRTPAYPRCPPSAIS